MKNTWKSFRKSLRNTSCSNREKRAANYAHNRMFFSLNKHTSINEMNIGYRSKPLTLFWMIGLSHWEERTMCKNKQCLDGELLLCRPDAIFSHNFLIGNFSCLEKYEIQKQIFKNHSSVTRCSNQKISKPQNVYNKAFINSRFWAKNCRQKPPKIAKMATNCHIWSH